MFRSIVLTTLCVVTFITPSHATPLPNEVMAQEFDSCMAGNGQQDGLDMVSRKAYCACTSSKLSSIWDLESYMAFSKQAAAGTVPKNELAKLQAIANSCIAKVLK